MSGHEPSGAPALPVRAFLKLALVLAFIGALFGVVGRFVIAPRFRSTASVFVSSEGRPSLSGALSAISSGLGGSLGSDPLASPYLSATFFVSREVLDSVANMPAAGGALGDQLLGRKRVTRADSLRTRVALEHSIVTGVDSRTSAISLALTAGDPALAQRLLVALITQVDHRTQQIRRDQARNRREFIQARVDVAAAALRSAEQAQVDFRQSNHTVQGPELVLEEKRRQRAVDMSQDVYTTLLRDRELALQDESKNVAALVVLASPDLPWQKSWPSGALLVLGGALSGVVGALFIALVALRRSSVGSLPPRTVGGLLTLALKGQ